MSIPVSRFGTNVIRTNVLYLALDKRANSCIMVLMGYFSDADYTEYGTETCFFCGEDTRLGYHLPYWSAHSGEPICIACIERFNYLLDELL